MTPTVHGFTALAVFFLEIFCSIQFSIFFLFSSVISGSYFYHNLLVS